MKATEIVKEPFNKVLVAYKDNRCVRMMLAGTAYTDGTRFYNYLTGGWMSINRPDLLGVESRAEASALLSRFYTAGYTILNVGARRFAYNIAYNEGLQEALNR